MKLEQVNMFRVEKKEFFAELLGTLVLMIFGLAVNAQVSLGDQQYGTYLSINLGWGLAVVFGVYVAGGVTGAHINPAVTLALAVNRQFPWSKVLPYMAAQFIGAFLASALIYVVYVEAIDAYEVAVAQEIVVQESTEEVSEVMAVTAEEPPPRTLKTAGIWATYPRQFSTRRWISNWSGFLDQVVGTALLLLCICALTDKRNMAPKSNLAPLLIGAVVLMIGMSMGANCAYAINPARDLSPRLFTWLAGWGDQVFRSPNTTWYLVPIMGPFLGGIIGVQLYRLMISRWHAEEEPESADG
ncbi:MAG: MIP/aquaporin family protein [Pirellulaceae bacterium]